MDLTFNIDKERKKINRMAVTVLVAAFIVIFIFPMALANDFIDSMAKSILTGGIGCIVETINGEGSFGSLYEICTDDLSGLLNGNTALINSIKGVGALLAMAIAIIHMFEAIDREQDPVEAIFKTLIELVITCLILVNADDIMGSLAEAGGDLAASFAGNTPEVSDADVQSLLKLLSGKTDGGVFWFMQIFVELSIPWILSILIGIAAKFAIIQIMLEIAIRRAFAPLAVADVYKEGIRSPGMRYFKKYFAAFIKLMICGFIGTLTPQITAMCGSMSGGVDGAFSYLFALIAVNLAAVGIILKGGEFANDIAGV